MALHQCKGLGHAAHWFDFLAALTAGSVWRFDHVEGDAVVLPEPVGELEGFRCLRHRE